MKRYLITAALAGVFLGALVVLAGWWQWNRPGPLPDAAAGDNTVQLRIPIGMTLSAAADSLEARGLLADRRVLLIGARLVGLERGLRAGLFELHYGRSPRELLVDLTSGLTVMQKVTVPEGLGAREIAALLSSELSISAEEFLTIADSLTRQSITRDGWLLKDEPLADADQESAAARKLAAIFEPESSPNDSAFHWCEGYLAPDTYLFGEGTPAADVAGHLVTEQLRRVDQAAAERSGKVRQLSRHELLTLASLVEAEARLPQERPLVAAVYANRLSRRMRLEADPTVAYFLQKKGRRLYFKDLKVDSPYNTYRVRGLPPGPIGSPGISALAAAAQPDSTSSDLYFVSDGAGGHVFSRTMKEHDEAVRRFRRIRAENDRR